MADNELFKKWNQMGIKQPSPSKPEAKKTAPAPFVPMSFPAKTAPQPVAPKVYPVHDAVSLQLSHKFTNCLTKRFEDRHLHLSRSRLLKSERPVLMK